LQQQGISLEQQQRPGILSPVLQDGNKKLRSAPLVQSSAHTQLTSAYEIVFFKAQLVVKGSPFT
jgi:hypothetical protein